MKDILMNWTGQKLGKCEHNLHYGEKLYLKPMREKPILIGFYCGTNMGNRVVQMKNSINIYIKYVPAFAATENELKRIIY